MWQVIFRLEECRKDWKTFNLRIIQFVFSSEETNLYIHEWILVLRWAEGHRGEHHIWLLPVDKAVANLSIYPGLQWAQREGKKKAWKEYFCSYFDNSSHGRYLVWYWYSQGGVSEYNDIVLIIHECNERAGLLVLCGAMWRSRHQAEGLMQRLDIDKDILAS